MSSAGKLIAVEGIDGSGKRTQVELLNAALQTRGLQTYVTGFPIYDSWFGRMAGQFLNGDFGTAVDPHFAALLYAGDRFEAKGAIEGALNAGKIVLADRYVASNLAHQTARVAAEKRAEFVTWIEHLEYQIYGLPVENLVIYLRVPPVESQKLVTLKATRTYTQERHDILEADLTHLQDAAAIYDRLARRPNWVTVQSFDEQRGAMRPPQEIAEEIVAAVETVVSAPAAARGKS
jgi:dTMP kinase